ncbi:MAG: putative methylaconitate Delta-isomerase PrpF [Burkholderiales bacterium RIFOXYC12_FULL_60_6]|nr:MAG: putative methylaconitate Delta-isomerase PrpF [Burkholderiales bacterium RIFOXYD12_FULL_59_19]OGB80820.1 MAG: putative methylaconitate Delta-isomerase PrpF [Burkholderiales bacterium RIFOXYC12_FULL_60_6]
MTQLRIPAVYMRGGTSKGVFFKADDLPSDTQLRDKILMRVIGSPDRYGKHIDGMGGATSSTSKVVVMSKSSRSDCDVDYLFGAVAVEKPVIDWSGNCGNLSAAVGPYAISAGLVEAPTHGLATVRIWQANIGKRIIAHVQMHAGEVQETGDFELDGVAFPAAEVKLEFIDPASDEGESEGGAMFPTGNKIDTLDIPGLGKIEVTLINAGNPTIFVEAASLGLDGTELQSDVNGKTEILKLAESIRAHGAVAMGLVATTEEATEKRPHTPKLAFVAKPKSYIASDGKSVSAQSIDMLARIFSMGQLHHAMTGTGAVAIAAAAAIPGTIVRRVAPVGDDGRVRFGHPSGSLSVGAQAVEHEGQWSVKKVLMSRTARRLMEGWVRVPAN